MPCSERSQGLLLLTQEMHYWDFLPRSFAPPHSFIPPWSSFCQSAEARCQPHPKARAECPHPLCASFTISPTHTFIQSPQHSPTPAFLYLFPLLFSPFSAFYIVFALQSFPQRSLLFRACNKTTNHLRCTYLHCYPSSSISCSTPTRSFILELLFRAFSCCLSLSHTLSLTHRDLNLNIHCQTCKYTTFTFNPLLLCFLFFSVLRMQTLKSHEIS